METEIPHKESSCPTAEELASYADLSLTGAPRRALCQHLRGCTDCSRAVLAMQRALSPIRDRHQGGGGWRGPWEAARGTMSEEVAPAWEEHLRHCARCAQRTALVQVRRPILAIGAAGVALGTAVGILAMAPRTPPRPQVSVVMMPPVAREKAVREAQVNTPPRPSPSPLPEPKPVRRPRQVAQRPTMAEDPSQLPPLSELRLPAAIYRGEALQTKESAFALLSPLQTQIRTPRPTLRWTALASAQRYEVLLVRSDTDTLLLHEETSALAMPVPTALPQGVVLAWEVHAITAEGQERAVAEGRFKVLPKDKLPNTTDPWDLARHGLYEEAEQQLSKRKETPRLKVLRRALENRRHAPAPR